MENIVGDNTKESTYEEGNSLFEARRVIESAPRMRASECFNFYGHFTGIKWVNDHWEASMCISANDISKISVGNTVFCKMDININAEQLWQYQEDD